MDHRIDEYLARVGGVGGRAELIEVVGRHRLDNEVKSGALVSVFPRAFARPWDADLLDVERRAALISVGGDVALSHVTALDLSDLPVAGGAPIHVTAYNPRHPRHVPGRLVVHRTKLPLDAVTIAGMPTVRLELSLVNSWPLLPVEDRRAPLIEAARRRMLRPQRIADLAERMWWLPGRPALYELVSLLLAGCESELEMWGYTEVFDVAGLRDASRQVEVTIDGKTYRLDQYYDDAKLDVELDGRKYHSSPQQRERDIKRDIAVAKLGIQTIRFSHDRLRYDVDACRRDALEVRSARLEPRQAGVGPSAA